MGLKFLPGTAMEVDLVVKQAYLTWTLSGYQNLGGL